MIGIVGAGITGLALSRHLHALGVDHVVLEACDQPGGAVRTLRRGADLLELGPQAVRLGPELRALVSELALGEEVLTADPGLPVFVYRRGALRRVPFTPRAFVGSDLVSWRGKARLLAEPFTRGPGEYETIESYFVRKLGREAYESMVAPLYGALFASDPARMMLRHQPRSLAQRLRGSRSLMSAWFRAGTAESSDPLCSFRGGMSTLPRALHQAVGDPVRLSTPARRIGREGLRGYRLETDRGHVPVRGVVITTPARQAAELVRDLAPDTAGRLEGLTYNPLALVHLDADGPEGGQGYRVAFDEDLETRSVTWNASLFGGRRPYAAILGGMRNPGLVELPATRLGEIAAQEFERVTGHAATALHVHRAHVPAWDVTWRRLEGFGLPPGIRISTNYMGRPGVGGRLEAARVLAVELAREEGLQVA